MNSKKMKLTHCKYCGARLKRDPVGQLCKTSNCQWEHGIPDRDYYPVAYVKKDGILVGL